MTKMRKMNTLEMTAENVFNFQENKFKFKQRSFEDCIGTSFGLIDDDLFHRHFKD